MRDFLRFAAICILLLIVVGGVIYGLGYAWTDLTGQQEMRRLEAEAEQARAQADRMREQAGLIQAEAARELARGEADAIRAPALAAAKTVNRQSAVLWWWGVLTPAGLLFAAFVLVVAGLAIGLVIATGGMALLGLDVRGEWQRWRSKERDVRVR